MKLLINMLSKADSVEGQGVGSAYIEQVNLVKEELSDYFDVRINSKKKADIVHVHSVNPSFYLRFKKKNGIRVMYCHFLPETLIGSIKLPKLFFNIYCKYVMSFYRKAEYLVVVNPIFIQDLVKLGVKEDHIKYIPNYVSNKQFHPISAEEVLTVKEKYNTPKNKFIVLGCGQVQTRKGVMDFVEVAKNNPDIEFVWAGGFSFKAITDGYNELKKVYENPPYPNIHFIGIIPRTEMNDIFNMADCLFMPSYNELFPMSILEAASVHKPILLRDLELYKDILWGNYLVGTSNEEFSSCIRKLAEDKEYYEQSCLLAKNISEYYSKENVAQLWKDFYLSIYEKNKEKNK